MKIVLIVGKSHAGKTTLIDGLCGKCVAANHHDDIRNTRELFWGNPPTIKKRTLVMASSLNEDNLYCQCVSRVFTKGARLGQTKYPNKPINTVAPWQLHQFLDLYDQPGNLTQCSRAILCINASVGQAGWTLQDYETEINNVGLGAHSVTHTISLFNGNYTGPGHQLINISPAPHLGIPPALHLAISQTGRPKRSTAPLTPAAVEAQARAHIHL